MKVRRLSHCGCPAVGPVLVEIGCRKGWVCCSARSFFGIYAPQLFRWINSLAISKYLASK